MANPTSPNPVVRLFPSLTDVAFLMPIVFLFFGQEGLKRMLEGDTGWHIRTGEWIIANRAVPQTDIFSYTRPGEPWFAWEWLWDVLFAFLHQQGGMAAVVLVSLLLLSVTSVLLFRLTLRKCGDSLLAIVFTFVAIAGSSIHWLARPHLFTLFFILVFYYLLERADEGRTRLLYWLPPIAALWTNLHGGFFVGVLLAGTYAAGHLIASAVEHESDARRAALLRSVPFLLAAAGSFLASFVNPYGYQLHVHIYGYLTESYHLRNIVEFLSLSFQHPLARFFELMLVLGAVAAFWRLWHKQFTNALILLGFAHMALFSARNIPIFLLLAAPEVALVVRQALTHLQQASVAAWLRAAVRTFSEISQEFGALDRHWRLHLLSLAAVALLFLVSYAPAPPAAFRAQYDPKGYPEKALAFLRESGLERRIFTNDEWGDFLIYRLYPDTKVFIDGRSDFYGEKFGQKYLDTLNVKYDWESNLARYRVDTILLPCDAPLSGALKESSRWRVLYDDKTAIVFETGSFAANSSGKMRDRTVACDEASDNKGDRKITQNQAHRRKNT
ncbi:MAG: hypothetical protein IT158_31655 [Bryobacterales bacterium]|nr:hypothetical protein [Bryobacterales bacterium]